MVTVLLHPNKTNLIFQNTREQIFNFAKRNWYCIGKLSSFSIEETRRFGSALPTSLPHRKPTQCHSECVHQTYQETFGGGWFICCNTLWERVCPKGTKRGEEHFFPRGIRATRSQVTSKWDTNFEPIHNRPPARMYATYFVWHGRVHSHWYGIDLLEILKNSSVTVRLEWLGKHRMDVRLKHVKGIRVIQIVLSCEPIVL